MTYKKTLALATGLVCLGLLGACSKASMPMEDSQMTATSQTMTDDQTMTDKMDKTMAEDKMSPDKPMADGLMAPVFQLKDLTGKTWDLSELKGKKVYLKFWASWCSICLASLADTEDLAAKADEDTVILSLVSPNQKGEQDEASFRKWYEGLEYSHLPVLLDSEGQLLKDYQVRSYPTNVFIDSDGVLVKTVVGFMDETSIQETLRSLN